MFINQAIIDHPPHFAHRHELLTAQDAQLMRDCRVISPQTRRQVAYAQLPLRRVQERVHYLQSRRIREQPEKRRCLPGQVNREQIVSHRQHVFWMHRSLLAHVRALDFLGRGTDR
jgi:hypothetical protein